MSGDLVPIEGPLLKAFALRVAVFSQRQVPLNLVCVVLGGACGDCGPLWLVSCFLGASLLARNQAWVQILALPCSRHLTLVQLMRSVSPSFCVSKGMITEFFVEIK